MPTNTIEDVVERMDDIVDRARRESHRSGYFAILYRNVTWRVKQGIASGRFEDSERMARLGVRFANRYFEAHDAYFEGVRPTESWKVAFEAAATWNPLVLQHLLVGMNAHINLDLGIAAARTCPGPRIVDLEPDFREINAILLAMLDDVQERLSRISPWFGILDLAGGTFDELVARIGLTGTRDWAWMNALHLAALDEEERQHVINLIDRRIAGVGRTLLNPGMWFSTISFIVRVAERGSVEEVMDALIAKAD